MDKPEFIYCNTLPGIAKYKCPDACGCNKLVKWTFDNGPLQRFHTYCEGNGNNVHYVEYTHKKALKLTCKMLIGLIYTDIEARPKNEIVSYALHIINTLGEHFNAEAAVEYMIRNKWLILRQEVNGVSYYTHNLPKTLSHRHERPNRQPA